MAANSLLYLLLATGLATPPTPPNEPVTRGNRYDAPITGQPFDYVTDEAKPRSWDRRRTEHPDAITEDYGSNEDEDTWPYADKPRAIIWPEDSKYRTEDPRYPVTRNQHHWTRDVVTRLDNDRTEDADQMPTKWPITRRDDDHTQEADQRPTKWPVTRRDDDHTQEADQMPTKWPVTRRDDDHTQEADQMPTKWPVTRRDDDHTQEADQMPTKSPVTRRDHDHTRRPARRFWSLYKTEDPSDQYPETRGYDHTEGADQRPTKWPVTRRDDDHTDDSRIVWPKESEYKTENPFDVTRYEDAEIIKWPKATEEPEHETRRPQTVTKHPKRVCKRREYLSIHCEKTCDNRKGECKEKKTKKTCICDPRFVRSEGGKCISRDECPSSPKKLSGNHGCPNNDECTKYCREHRGKHVGSCQGMQHMECLCPE